MNQSDLYDEDYFQHGITTGLSCYEKYRWLPDKTIPMCMSLIDHLGIKPGHTILDYGCARAYMLKSFRILNRESWGCDLSDYAITHCDREMRDFVRKCDGTSIPWPQPFTWCISKDTLEHVPEKTLPRLLRNISKSCRKAFIIVPLASREGRYLAEVEEMDKTHEVRRGMQWWLTLVGRYFEVKSAGHHFPGLKGKYEHVRGGHAFIVGEREEH